MKSKQPELSFEEAFDRLEKLVQRLEEAEMPLEDSLALYEEGMALARHCQDLLDQAELRVSKLTETVGGIDEEPFEEDEE